METLERRLVFSFSPTGMEQEMLELLNRMRMDPSDELDEIFLSTDSNDTDYFTTADSDVNLALTFFGVDDATLFSQWSSVSEAPPLAWNEALYDAAHAHNDRTILQNMQSHQLPADPTLGLPTAEAGLLDRTVAAGYNWSGSVRLGENVFAYTESVFHGHAAFAIDWGDTATGIQNPTGHRDNMLDAEFQEIGISIVEETPVNSTDVGPLVLTTDFGVRGNYGDPRALGVVFDDADGDDFYDAGEGLGGVTITISNGTNQYTTTTMDAGGWQVAVAAGTYDVVASGGGLTTSYAMGNITVSSDNVKVDLNINAAPTTGDVTGYVFHDTDADGNIDATESRLAGWTVFADANNNGSVDTGEASDVTDNEGYYELLAITPGSVTVTVVDQMGYRPTSPPSGTEQVTVGAGAIVSDTNFGQYQFYLVAGSTGTLFGTGQADTFTWQAGTSNHTVSVNGESVTIDIGTVSNVVLDAGNGDDTITMTGDAREESFLIRAGTIDVTGSGYTIEAKKFESGDVYSGGDPDSIAYLYDTSSDDVFTATTTMAQMVGGGLDFTAHNFKEVHGRSTDGGNDYAYLHDGASNDVFSGVPAYGTLQGSGGEFFLRAQGFDRVLAFGTAGGNDIAYLHDAATDDVLTARQHNSVLRGSDYEFYNKVNGFEFVFAYSTAGGNDKARMYDSSADDTFDVEQGEATMTRADGSYKNVAEGFGIVRGYAENGGADVATLNDSQGDDSFTGVPTYSKLVSASGDYDVFVVGFGRVIAHSTAGGTDYAYLYDGTTDDRFTGRPNNAVLRAVDDSFYYKVNGFDRAIGFAESGGEDFAYLYDDWSDDRLTATANNTVLRANDYAFYNKVNDFERVHAYSTAGTDKAYLYDAATDEELSVYSDHIIMRATDDSFYNYAAGFAETYTYADGGGNNIAAVYDSAGDDLFTAHHNYGTISGTGYYHFFAYFTEVLATASSGGNDSAYLHDSSGDDDFVGIGDSAYLSGVNFYNQAIGFDLVRAIGTNGGTNQLTTTSIDYVLEQVGSWL